VSEIGAQVDNFVLQCAADMERSRAIDVLLLSTAAGDLGFHIQVSGACPTNLAAYNPETGTAQCKISTTWSASFRLPTLVTESTRTKSLSYDSSGNLLTRTITDTTVSPRAASAAGYSAVWAERNVRLTPTQYRNIAFAADAVGSASFSKPGFSGSRFHRPGVFVRARCCERLAVMLE
jgi:hypothetical protein